MSVMKMMFMCIHIFITYEPLHDNTKKMTCVPSEDSDQPGLPSSLISLHCPHEEILGPYRG